MVEQPSGQTTFLSGIFNLTCSLTADTSAGGLASALFDDGSVTVLDSANAALLLGNLTSLDLHEVRDNIGYLSGSGLFTVTGGSLASQFGPMGEPVVIFFRLSPRNPANFSQSISGQTDVTLMPIPEPAALTLLALGGVVALVRRRR